jgi:hypothetical protein
MVSYRSFEVRQYVVEFVREIQHLVEDLLIHIEMTGSGACHEYAKDDTFARVPDG